MSPFYFGRSEKSLFGIYHPSVSKIVRNCGIVICQPIGHEYIHGYRALRQLAHQLARAGFAVLRFDYYGCGDSAGNPNDGNFVQWMSDTEAAIEEIKSRGTLSKICLIGARIGATVSVLVGNKRSDLEAVVLWDPIVNGKYYLANLIEQQQEWLNERPRGAVSPSPKNNGVLEVLGFAMSAALQDDLNRLDLLSLKIHPAKRILTLESDKTLHVTQLSDHLKAIGGESEYQHISTPQVWRKNGRDNAVVPRQMLQAIVDGVSRITS